MCSHSTVPLSCFRKMKNEKDLPQSRDIVRMSDLPDHIGNKFTSLENETYGNPDAETDDVEDNYERVGSLQHGNNGKKQKIAVKPNTPKQTEMISKSHFLDCIVTIVEI